MSSVQNFQPTKQQIFGAWDSFRLLITASSGSGKSQLAKDILIDPSWGLQSKFKVSNIYVFSPTMEIDDAWHDIKKSFMLRSTKDDQFNEQEQFFKTDLEQSMATIYNQICEKSMNAKFGKEKQEHTLMVLDDCLLEINMSTAHSQLAKQLVKMRHHKASIIVISQYLKSLHPIARSQFSHYITFSTSNNQEVQKIRQECSSTLSAKQFLDLYNFCTDSKYGYMLVIFSWPTKFKYFKGQGGNIEQLQM